MPNTSTSGMPTPRMQNWTTSVSTTARIPPTVEYAMTMPHPIRIPQIGAIPRNTWKMYPIAPTWAPTIPAHTTTENTPVTTWPTFP